MTGSISHSRPKRPRSPSTKKGPLSLNAPPENSFGKANLFLAFGLLCLIGLIFNFGGKALRQTELGEDHVQIVEEAPPVEIKQPPKPPPPPPEPPKPVPQPKEAVPPPPVFGVPEEATNQAGDLAVATGNTLMKPADSVVQKAPPLPPAPVELDKRPAVLNQVVPDYPPLAEEQGITATVKLLVTIDGSGKVQNVSVQTSGGREFDRNAIKAVQATRFQPLIRDGVALPARFLFTYEFTL